MAVAEHFDDPDQRAETSIADALILALPSGLSESDTGSGSPSYLRREMGRGAGAEGPLVLARRGDDPLLVSLQELVRVRLPWTSTCSSAPAPMRVVEAGYLEEEHELYPMGTPFVTIAVESWEAADAVHAALEDIAGLDREAWVLDWYARGHDDLRRIRIYPNPRLVDEAA